MFEIDPYKIPKACADCPMQKVLRAQIIQEKSEQSELPDEVDTPEQTIEQMIEQRLPNATDEERGVIGWRLRKVMVAEVVQGKIKDNFLAGVATLMTTTCVTPRELTAKSMTEEASDDENVASIPNKICTSHLAYLFAAEDLESMASLSSPTTSVSQE